jgi:hypothetical protein
MAVDRVVARLLVAQQLGEHRASLRTPVLPVGRNFGRAIQKKATDRKLKARQIQQKLS